LRVLVDSSAWADFLNGYPSLESAEVAALIRSDHELCTCGVIVAEVFQGLRREKGRAELAQLFGDLVLLEPVGLASYFRAADLYRALRQRGKTIRSTIDCLIAVLAAEHSCYLLARDRDLETIVESRLLTTALWPPAAAGV